MVLDVGTVVLKKGVLRASGLKNVSAGEMVKIGNVLGKKLYSETEKVRVKEGDRVERSNSLMSINIRKEKQGFFANEGHTIHNKLPFNKISVSGRGILSLSASSSRNSLYNNVHKRTMKTMCQVGGSVRKSRIFISNVEHSAITLMKKLADEVDPAVIHQLPRHVQEVEHVLFAKRALTLPNTEIMAQLDGLKTIYPNKVIKKTAIIDAFNKDGSNIEDSITVLGKENNCAIHSIGEFLIATELTKNNIGITLMDEKGESSLYTYQTRQKHCDLELHYPYQGTIHTRGFDIKFGNIKHENQSTIVPIVYDEQTDSLAGIFNTSQLAVKFLENKIKFLHSIQDLEGSGTAKNLLQKQIDLLHDKYLAFPEKITHSNALGLEICGALKAKNIKGLYNPSLYVVSKGSFVDTGHNTLSKYPHGLDTYAGRRRLYLQFLIENDLIHLIPKLALFKGTAFETIFSDITLFK